VRSASGEWRVRAFTLGIEIPHLCASLVPALSNLKRNVFRLQVSAFGSAVSAVFKLLARYDETIKLYWDQDWCDVLDTHVRFYLHGRKNLQHGSALLDVARPADNNPNGIYRPHAPYALL